MKIILVAGGSGGHIYPALELAKYLRSKNEEVLMCGSINSFEEKVYLENNLDFKGIRIKKKNILSEIKARKEIAKIYEEFKPDSVILFGNYISFMFGIVAYKKKIKIYLHEQNVIYGLANKVLGLFARKIFLSLPIKKNLYKKKSTLVGNPKSTIVKNKLILNHDKKSVLIVMGSLGSMTINRLLKELIIHNNTEYNYYIVTGKKYYSDFISHLKERDNIKVYPYLSNLVEYAKECDLFISRSGATTISEITANGIASLLIPSPYVKNNHQYKNARYLEQNSACKIILEKDLTASKLQDEIDLILKDEILLETLKTNARKLAVLNASKSIYKEIYEER